jgi:hypothetical protein
MALLKDQQTGSSGDPFTVAGTLVSSGTVDITGAFRLDGTAGASGQVLLSGGGTNTPTWGAGIPAGIIVMWSGTIATIPSGWLLCNGSSSTPDLRNRFIIGAFQDTTGVAYTTVTGADTQTGGSKDAITVSHTHTATSTVTDAGHAHGLTNYGSAQAGDDNGGAPVMASTGYSTGRSPNPTNSATTGITVATTNASAGSSGTNANLVPYYALAYIMKA